MNQNQNKYPLITVRIPAFNHEKFVCKSLDSVRLQSYPNKEIAIIDDGSTDDTEQKIKEWIAQHGKTIDVNFLSRKKKGISATLNQLIDMSKGQYIAALASDDYLLPDSLSIRYEYLRKHPEKMAVFGDSIVVDENGMTLYKSGLADLHSAKKEYWLTDEGLKKEIIQNWSVPGPTLMVRRSLHTKIRFNENLQVEDRDFYLRLVADNLLGFIDKPIAAYRVHGKNFCLDKKNRFISSVNKFKSLTMNIHRFPMRDRILFIIPIVSSVLGVVIHYIIKKLGHGIDSQNNKT